MKSGLVGREESLDEQVLLGDNSGDLAPEIPVVGGVSGSLPPIYSTCLSDHQPIGSSSPQTCIPTEQPPICDLQVWFEVNQAGLYEVCQEQEEAVLGGGSGSLPPNYSACLSDHHPIGFSAPQTCIPISKPVSCSNEIWNEVIGSRLYERCRN